MGYHWNNKDDGHWNEPEGVHFPLVDCPPCAAKRMARMTLEGAQQRYHDGMITEDEYDAYRYVWQQHPDRLTHQGIDFPPNTVYGRAVVKYLQQFT